MQYVIIPKSLNYLDEYQSHGADSFIVGLQDYSVNYPEVSLQELKQLSLKYSIFVALNKNIRNEELEDLENILVQLSNLKLEGVLFYDLSILSIVERMKLKLPLVWHQTHMVTNYQTCNYYLNHGVKYGFISNEITLEEILEMKEKTLMKLMVQVVGYPVMSHSRRKLIQNYFADLGQRPEKEVYTLMEKGNDTFLIRESHAGTTMLFGKPINGTKALYELLEKKLDCAVLDMTFLEESIGIEVLDLYQEIRSTYSKASMEEKQEKIARSNKLLGDSTNFFYKKTIYKVKRGKV